MGVDTECVIVSVFDTVGLAGLSSKCGVSTVWACAIQCPSHRNRSVLGLGWKALQGA